MSAQKISKLLLSVVVLFIPVYLTTDISAATRSLNFKTLDQHIAPRFERFNFDLVTTRTPRPTRSPSSQPTTTPKSSTTPTATTQANVSAYPQQILDLVNNARKQQNLSTLTLHDNLNTSAQAYAKQMATENFFAHTTPNGGTMKQRIIAAGYTPYRWIAENIAAGQRTPQEVFNGWMNSSGHKANILNTNAQHLGVGYYQTSNSTYKHYWVQHFGSK